MKQLPLPLFTKRKRIVKKQQVRFWADPELYNLFARYCKDNDLFIQDVFEELMHWTLETKILGKKTHD